MFIPDALSLTQSQLVNIDHFRSWLTCKSCLVWRTGGQAADGALHPKDGCCLLLSHAQQLEFRTLKIDHARPYTVLTLLQEARGGEEWGGDEEVDMVYIRTTMYVRARACVKVCACG